MIDEKKIEEAANDIISKQFYPFFESVKDYRNQSKKDFKAGINWFLDNIWHHASEEPKMYKGLLVEYQDKSVILLTYSRKGTWSYVVNRKIKKRWLYIEDLMKGGK